MKIQKCDRDKPIAFDLFAGAGFMGLGFRQAGFDIRAAVEFFPAHADRHRLLFPEIPMIEESVAGVGKTELYLAAGLGPHEEVDLIFGGPPCQGFSTQGHNRPDDIRRSLSFDFARIVREVRPKHFVFENVKGLAMKNNRPVLDALIKEFSDAGYECTPWRVLNAKDYGVAQSRERLFLLGSRRDHPPIEYPQPTGSVTCREVLGDLEAGSGLSGHNFVAHAPAVIERFSKVLPGQKDSISRFVRLDPESVSPTLLAGTATSSDRGGAHTAKRPIHYRFDRVLTVRELARLHGISDEIDLSGATYRAVMQIGNSVPPPLAKAVGLEVRRSLDLE